MFSLLQDRTIRLIYTSEVVNSFGSSLSMFALSWKLRQSDPRLAGAVIGAQTLGTLFGVVILGSFLDRWPRGRTLVVTNAMAATLMGALAMGLRLQLAPVVLVGLAALFGFVTGVQYPAIFSAIPLLVHKDRVQQVNALFNSTWQVTGLVAPVLAGVFTSFMGATNVLLLDALSFAIAASVLYRVSFPPPPKTVTEHSGINRWWIETREGVTYFFRHPILWATMLGVMAMNGGFTMTLLVLPRAVEPVAKNLSWLSTFGDDRGAVAFGLIDIATVLVELLTTIAIAKFALGKKDLSARVWTLVGCVLPLIGLAVICSSTKFSVMLIIGALIGMPVALIGTVWPTLFARNVPDEMLGRVFSVRSTLGGLAAPLSSFVAGSLLVGNSPARAATLIASAFVAIAVLGFVLALVLPAGAR